jgi:hypothetical protein
MGPDRQRERAMSKLPVEFWQPAELPPIPFLADLREIVLDHSEKRCPKWRFRFAPELGMQIQPRPVVMISAAAKARGWRQRVILFQGVAVQGEDLSLAAFLPGNSHLGEFRLNFDLFAEEGAEAWAFKAKNVRWRRGQDHTLAIPFRDRVAAELRAGRLDRLSADMMFQPACLICGKGLTDPASMARWIGPECAGTASLDVGLIAFREATP